MPRPRPLEPRKPPFRDASLSIIATEDVYASPQYIHALQEKELVDRTRVRVVVLPPLQGRTSIAGIISRLDDYRNGGQAPRSFLPQDQFWIVFDVDHHRPKELSGGALDAKKKSYQLAGSNPCFEVWLYLHESNDLSTIRTHAEDSTAADQCEQELRRIMGGSYNKKNIDTSRITGESVRIAMERAERRDDRQLWPASVGTHMHRLLKSLPGMQPAG